MVRNFLKVSKKVSQSFKKFHKVSQSFKQQISIQKLLKISSKIKVKILPTLIFNRKIALKFVFWILKICHILRYEISNFDNHYEISREVS